MKDCPICKLPLLSAVNAGDATLIKCKRCGEFVLSRSAIDDLPATLTMRKDAIALLSHFVRRLQLSQARPKIDTYWIDRVLKEQSLPAPDEQVGYLILALGSTKKIGVGEHQSIRSDEFMGLVGSMSIEGFDFLVKHLEKEGLVEGAWQESRSAGAINPKGQLYGRLTIKGWERYSILQRTGGSGTRAFMAMKFGDPELDGMYKDRFRQAVARTGFELRKLDDEPRAGLIDDRLRVEIRQARFLLSDLTHANNGAYWEAGYAEGLGKPVIYLCKKSAFEDPKTRPHFDTNHHLTIVWDAATIADDMARLTATIRFTIPEAKQAD